MWIERLKRMFSLAAPASKRVTDEHRELMDRARTSRQEVEARQTEVNRRVLILEWMTGVNDETGPPSATDNKKGS